MTDDRGDETQAMPAPFDDDDEATQLMPAGGSDEPTRTMPPTGDDEATRVMPTGDDATRAMAADEATRRVDAPAASRPEATRRIGRHTAPSAPMTERLVMPEAGRSLAGGLIATIVVVALLVGGVFGYRQHRPSDANVVARALVGPGGGVLTFDGTGKLTIPKGALPSPTAITVRRDTIDERVRLGAEGAAGTVTYEPGELVVYAFEPPDLRFQQPVTIELPRNGDGSAVFVDAPGAPRVIPGEPSGNVVKLTTNELRVRRRWRTDGSACGRPDVHLRGCGRGRRFHRWRTGARGRRLRARGGGRRGRRAGRSADRDIITDTGPDDGRTDLLARPDRRALRVAVTDAVARRLVRAVSGDPAARRLRVPRATEEFALGLSADVARATLAAGRELAHRRPRDVRIGPEDVHGGCRDARVHECLQASAHLVRCAGDDEVLQDRVRHGRA